MMKRMLALLLGILLLCSFALAEDADEISGLLKTDTVDQENYMVPRQFMNMFNETFKISADLLRSSVGDEEADRLVEAFSLVQDDIDADKREFYYGSQDWAIEVVFVFENAEDVSPDTPAFRWYLCLDDEAGENAARLTMYTLNLLIGYRHKDTIGSEAVLNYFQTFTLGEALELPDGYEFVILRPDDADYVVFSMQPPV